MPTPTTTSPRAYLAEENFAKAISNYDEAVKLDPKHALSYKGRGIAEFLSGGKEKAEADIQQVLALTPSDTYALLCLNSPSAGSAPSRPISPRPARK